MKKVLSLIAVAGMFTFASCGQSAEEKAATEAAAEQAIQDSIAAAAAEEAEAAAAAATTEADTTAATTEADTTAASTEEAQEFVLLQIKKGVRYRTPFFICLPLPPKLIDFPYSY